MLPPRIPGDPDPSPNARANHEVGPSAPEEASTSGLRWVNVNYGGVTFLVGSYRTRDRDGNDDRRRRRPEH